MTLHDLPEAPRGSLLAEIAAREAAFTDAYALQLPRPVSLAAFVQAFYTSPLFRCERAVLGLFGARSTDAQAQQLADGTGEHFAVWRVHARRETELLLTDRSGITSSWLCVRAVPGGTELAFGSALRSRRRGADGQPYFGWAFHALLGLHRAYSRALLRAAARRL